MIEILFATFNVVHEAGFEYHETGIYNDWWLLLQTHCQAFFEINGTRYTMPPETAILYPPHTPLHYGSIDCEFSNDWIRFHTDDDYICNGKIPFSRPFEVKEYNFTHYVYEQIASENFFENKNKTRTISLLFKLMFCKLEESLDFQTEHPQVKELLALRLEISNNPGEDWSIPTVASRLHVSIGYLHILYRRVFGTTCMEDIIQMRLDLAMDYLEHTTIPIGNIANKCGYKNVEHFSRQFKNSLKITPREFRKRKQH